MDAEDVTTVIRSIEPADCNRLTEIDRQLTGLSRGEWFERKLDHEFGEVHVSIGAEVDGLLVGAVLGSVRRGEFGLTESIAVIDTILVDRDYQGRGIATAMLERLAQNLRAFGVRRLRTDLPWDEKKLNGFLSRHGFHPVEGGGGDSALESVRAREKSLSAGVSPAPAPGIPPSPEPGRTNEGS